MVGEEIGTLLPKSSLVKSVVETGALVLFVSLLLDSRDQNGMLVTSLKGLLKQFEIRALSLILGTRVLWWSGDETK